MNLFDKVQATLTELFASLTLQQALTVGQNIKKTLPLLDNSAHQLLVLMKDKDIKFDEFLADQCLPLLRFYLAPSAMQQDIFLKQAQLAEFFRSIPVVEAYILKEKIEITLHHLPVGGDNSVIAFPPSENRLQITGTAKLAELQNSFSSAQTYAYLDCFYQLQEGELQVVDSQQSFHQNMMLYSELSPLQQLQAQVLLKQNKNAVSA